MAGNGTLQSSHAASQTADWPIQTPARPLQPSSDITSRRFYRPDLGREKVHGRSFGLAACNALRTFWASLSESLTLSAHRPESRQPFLPASIRLPSLTPPFYRQPTFSPLHLLAQTLTVHAIRVIVVLVEFELTASECAALPFIFFPSLCVSSRIPALVISNLNPSFRAPPQNLYHQPSPACTSITICNYFLVCASCQIFWRLAFEFCNFEGLRTSTYQPTCFNW